LYFPKRKKAFIEGDGNQSRDFCYVDNVVSANILAMKSRKKFKGEFFNIASGGRIAVNTVKKMIEELSGKKLNLQKRPKRIGDVRHTYADISKARKWLNYKPVINFEEGLKRTINWFETRK
jgi:nucleoside-diphosphate-sugar epimerase